MSLEKDGNEFPEDTKLLKVFKTTAGFKGVHENHIILKGSNRLDENPC